MAEAPAILYDLSRLTLRVARSAPSGIDRVDLAWARAALDGHRSARAIILTALGPRVVCAAAATAILDIVETRWGQRAGFADADPVIGRVRAEILGRAPPPERRQVSSLRATAGAVLGIFRRAGIGRDGVFPARPLGEVPQNSVYINVSQFPLAIPRLSGWLSRRPDLHNVIMVHDMLPITAPEFFPPREYQQHVALVARAASLATTLVVTGPAVERALADYLASAGLRTPEIRVVPPNIDPIFAEPPQADADLRAVPYFVTCGTIEPRKNHLLLLNIWRELAERHGSRTPKLVIVGALGWENENVLDMLERCDAIRPHVVRAHGLGTRGLKTLLDNCRALLMPSFAEGFGLPVAEAVAAGVPSIVSDLPSLAGLEGPITRLDPLDGLGWRSAIENSGSRSVQDEIRPSDGPNESCLQNHVQHFIQGRIDAALHAR